METKPNYKVSWTTIYSLGLVPLIVVWGLAPIIDELTFVISSILVGIVWVILSRHLIHYPQGCGILAWATGWSMMGGSIGKALLMLLGDPNFPFVLFLAPLLTLLLYLFEKKYVQPSFCLRCIALRGGIQERKLVSDFSRHEVQVIAYLILCGGILVTLLTWGLFIYGIEQESRAGLYFYHYFPLGLSLAAILFEVIRRILIQLFIESHENKSKQLVVDNKEVACYTLIRIIVICQGKIFLKTVDMDSPCHLDDDSGLDSPIHPFQEYCTTLNEEKQLAQKAVWKLFRIENPDLRHLSSTTSPTHLRRVGQYLLFLPTEEKSKLDSYIGEWYSTEELNQLYRDNKLNPLFGELYARLYTVVTTALTYYPNGKRRLGIKGYTPTFSLLDLEKSDIELDNPIWLYVSKHNDDKLCYRLCKKLFTSCHKRPPHV